MQRLFKAAALSLLLSHSAAAAQIQLRPTLWQIGTADDSSSEFGDYATAKGQAVNAHAYWNPEFEPQVPLNQAVPKGLKADVNPAFSISYRLRSVPPNGVRFRFKLLNAHKNGAQLAAFSNGSMAGLIQLWGTAGTSSPHAWKKTHELYIPGEMLQRGLNTLRLEIARPLWASEKWDGSQYLEWDYLQLQVLEAPAVEPIHGHPFYLGTTLKHSGGDFKVDAHTLALAPVALQWLGIAYSGNAIRADFWHDVESQQPERLKYLQALRDLNMRVVVDNISSYHFALQPDGTLPAQTQTDLKSFFARYGGLFQFYELENEPTNFVGSAKQGGTHAAIIALAKYINAIKPAHVVTTAPGWAYGGKQGVPAGWEADAAMRRAIEDLCGATNGHSYGFSYADNTGGSFVEQLKTFGGVSDGWPKPFVNTETGANNWHSEENGGTHLPSAQSHASAFDRVLRAHVAVTDFAMQHALIFDDFSLFNAPTNWGDPRTLSAYPAVEGEAETRLKTFRRIALAYATHGRPLPTTLLNRAALAGKKVLARCVDTSGLAPLEGSQGRSGKLLLNFVNFEDSPQVLEARITLPARGLWSGLRIGPGDTYAASHGSVQLQASPTLDLKVSLGAGESVQYILGRGPMPAIVTVATPDLAISRITLAPQNPQPGQDVTLSATIENRGAAPSPAGVTHGVKFLVDGKSVCWSDRFNAALAPGQSVTVTANNGEGGVWTWKAVAGAHVIEAQADDVDRIAESDERNNSARSEVTIGAPAATAGTGAGAEARTGASMNTNLVGNTSPATATASTPDVAGAAGIVTPIVLGRGAAWHRKVDGPYIALTFDDGPLPQSAPILLAALRKAGMTATFCVQGNNSSKHPELVKAILAAGCEIASHSWSHPNFREVGPERAREEMRKTDQALLSITGERPKYLRPPYGATNDELNQIMAREFGYSILLWSYDSQDWQKPAPGAVTDRILHAQAGDIILAHESFPQSVREMPAIIEALAAKGLKSVTVSELLRHQIP